MNVYVNGVPVALTQRDYIAEGGEGKVYARGDIGYKVYHDPKKTLPVGKIRELQRIQNPNVIRPLDVITDAKGTPLGYTMRFVRDPWTLCQLFPKPFRDRNGVTHDMMRGLVQELQALFQSVHDAGILLVDANEMNFLVTKDFHVVLGIDADSYQTQSYPATAIMASVRDWQVHHNNWTEGSDWFSFACVSFQMFTALHPFKGKHPTVNGMEARMQAGISVLDPSVSVPSVAYDFGLIPKDYMDWYKRVFVKGERCAPPSKVSGAVQVQAPKVTKVQGTNLVVITEHMAYDAPVLRFWTQGTHVVALTEKSLWVDDHLMGPGYSDAVGCGFTLSHVPVLALHRNGEVVLENVQTRKRIELPGMRLLADEAVSHDGRIYTRHGDKVYEITLSEIGGKAMPLVRPVVNVMPFSSHLYPGVTVQSILGSAFPSLLTQAGAAYQVRMPELDKYRILDAKAESNMLMVVGEHAGVYDRLVVRFDDTYTAYDIRTVADIQPSGLNFTVLDSGVCACLNEDGKLELCSRLRGSTAFKLVDDPAIPGDAILGKTGGTLLFAQGNRINTMKMK